MGLWLKQDDGSLVEVSGTGEDGKGWTGGSYDPETGTVTFTSDDGLEFTTGDLRGTDGIDGLDGNMWHVGSGDPDPTLGEDDDYYLDGDAGWVWIKRLSGWTNLYVNLTGPPGPGIEDAPSDGDQYARQDGAWTVVSGGGGDYLPLTGGTVTGDLKVDGQMLASRGSGTAPGLSFADYKGTGFYPGSNNVATHVNGAWQFVVYEDKTRVIRDLQVDGLIKAKASSGQTAPSYGFTGDTEGLGLYGSASSQWLRFAAGGVWRLQVATEKVIVKPDLQVDGQTLAQNGTTAAPAYSFASDTDTGMYRKTTNQVAFAMGGKLRAVVGTNGTRITGPNVGDSNKTWEHMQLRVESENTGGNDSSNSMVGVAFWAQRPGIAPIMRNHKAAGETLGFVNSQNSAFVHIYAKGVLTPAKATTKRNIKTVEDDAVISLAEKWLMAEFDEQVGPLSVRLKPEAAVRQAALLEAGEELPPADPADYESVDHDCALDTCDGTPENPCPVIVNHRSEWGGIAEWWGEVAPQQVVFDEHGEAAGIKLEQVAATALGAVGALSRRLTEALERIEALTARIETVEDKDLLLKKKDTTTTKKDN